MGRLIPSPLCTGQLGQSWNIVLYLFNFFFNWQFFFSMISEHTSFPLEIRSFRAPQQESRRWGKGWKFDSNIGSDPSYSLILKNKQNKPNQNPKRNHKKPQPTKNTHTIKKPRNPPKPNKQNTRKTETKTQQKTTSKDIQPLAFFSLSFLPSGCPNVAACCKLNCCYSTWISRFQPPLVTECKTKWISGLAMSVYLI